MWPIAMSRESVPCGCQQPPKSTANLSVAIMVSRLGCWGVGNRAPSPVGVLEQRRDGLGGCEKIIVAVLVSIYTLVRKVLLR